MGLLSELRRRNVIKVGIAYAITAWLLIEIAATTFPILRLPDWTVTLVTALVLIGFPLALILAWAYELTPEGIRLDEDAVASEPVPHRSGRKLDFAIIGLMAAGILYLVLDSYVLEESPSEPAAKLTQEVTSPEGKIMLAVLPLDNLSGDPEQEYFSDGLTEEMIAQLTRLQRDQLGVIARTSVMHYKGKNKRIDEIGRELGVDYLVEGSVRRFGDRVRITAQLIQVSDQTHLWAESFEREVDDIFDLQSEVAQRIARTLELELMVSQQDRLQRTRPSSVAAYDAYLKGRHIEWGGAPEDFLEAIEHYEEAIRLDPEYALAYATLGHAWAMLGYIEHISPSESDRMWLDNTQKAAELDPDLAEVVMNIADYSYYTRWDWAASEAGFRRAFELDPGSDQAVFHYGLWLNEQGYFEEAIALLESSLRLNPRSPELNLTLLSALRNSHQYDRAIEHLWKMIESEPRNADLHRDLGRVYEDMGRDTQAVESYLMERVLAGDGNERVQALKVASRAGGIQGYRRQRLEHLKEMATREDISPLTFAHLYARLGEKDEALVWVDKLKETAQREHVTPMTFVYIYALVGESDQACAWLETAYEQRNRQLTRIKTEWRLEALRDDPCFQDLLRRMKFPE